MRAGAAVYSDLRPIFGSVPSSRRRMFGAWRQITSSASAANSAIICGRPMSQAHSGALAAAEPNLRSAVASYLSQRGDAA